MEPTVNETYLKLSSKVPLSHPFSLGEDITVTIKPDSSEASHNYIFNVVKEEINDLQDGTVNKTYVAKSLIE
jgi:hypothetical protein